MVGRVVGRGNTAYGGLGVFADDLVPFANQLIQQAVERAEGAAMEAGQSVFVTAMREAKRVTSQQLAELERVITDGIAPDLRLKAHKELGVAGQQSVLASYRASKGRSGANPSLNRGGTGSKWQRYAGGRLEKALADPEFFTATATELLFINIGMLDARAAQWARLNFGAGARGKGSAVQEPIRMGTLVIASLQLNEPARPAMFMPAGYFVAPGGAPVGYQEGKVKGASFFPYKTGPHRGRFFTGPEGRQPLPIRGATTGEFEGRQFLDAGVRRIGREFGDKYQDLYQKLFEQGEVSIRPYRLRTTARPFR